MNIGSMNERITIQQHTVAPDTYGNHVKTWTDYFSCSAYAATFAKAEAGGVVSLDEREVEFLVRYCSELSALSSDSYRVIFHDQIYNIASVDPMNWKRKTIKIRCEKEQRSAVTPPEPGPTPTPTPTEPDPTPTGGSNVDQN